MFCFATLFVFSAQFVRAQNSTLQFQKYSSSEAVEEQNTKFAAQLDSCHLLTSVASQTGASTSDMIIFSNYYADTLYADRVNYIAELGNKINTNEDIQKYAKALIAKYTDLYQKLEQLKKDYPNTVAEYSSLQSHKPAATCSPTCSDIGFESGTLTGWNAYYAKNTSTSTKMIYTSVVGGAAGAVTEAAYDIVTDPKYHKNPDYQVKIMSGAGNDPIAGPIIPIVAPGGGNYSVRLGDTSVGGSRVAIIDQAFTVTAGNTALNYMYAPIVDMPGYQYPHTWGQQPHFIVTITDQATGDTLQCGDYLVTSSTTGANYSSVWYTVPAYGWQDTVFVAPWKTVFVSLQNYVGHCIDIQAIVSDCYPTALGPHFCYVYFDATCGPLSIIASTPSVCGGNVTLTAPSGGASYSWAGPCVVGSATSPTITASCSGTYTVTVVSADGCSDTLQKTITVTPTMSVTASSTNASCGVAGTAIANPTGGTPPYSYSWSNGNTNQKDTGLGAGNYACIVSAAGCLDTVKVTITGSGMTATIANTTPKCFGDTLTVTVTPNGGKTPYTYSWNTGATGQSLNGVTAGTYSCVVKDASGCSFSQSVTVKQPAQLLVKPSTFPATCNYLCNGQAIATPSGGTNPLSFLWSNGATGASISNLCVGTSYTVTVTDGHGCKTDTSVIITNPPPIVLSTDSTPSLCNKTNGAASITATGGTPGFTYKWSTGATTSSITNVAAGNYCVLILDANKCRDSSCINVPNISGDSIKIVAITNVTCNGGNNGSIVASVTGGTGPFTYAWTPSGGNTTTATNLSADTYTITVTDNNGCPATAVATVKQPPPITITAPGQTICIGQTATLTATANGGTTPYTYNWTPGGTGQSITVSPTVTTSYTVQATDANGCASAPLLVVVTVRPPLTIAAGPPKSFCPGDTATISASATGGDGTYFYLWSPGGATTSSIQVTPVTTTVYTVVINDGCGTPAVKDSVTITVLPVPVVNLKADTLQGCYPLCVTFTNLATVTGGATIASYNWSFGDGNSSTQPNPSHCYTKPGVYSVSLSVVSSNGCIASFSIPNYITVYSHPVANFSLSPQPTNIMNPTIYFVDHSTDAYGIINWFWQFGDGTDSIGFVRNPQHTYGDTGSYCVNLQVTNFHGCVADTTECLEIEPFFVIYVPNAFTPNGNGVNDLFTAKGVGILQYQMWIFDRWGQQIYTTTDIYGGWDGKVQNGASGAQAQEDTYVWLIEVTDVFHKQHRYVGRVSLIK